MTERTPRLLLFMGVLLLCGLPLHAATVSVGTCLPAYPHFSTIQAAINASPLGGTVLVCPGVYYENIQIFHPLTLKGVNAGGSNLALIQMPFGTTGAQVYVQATGVYISDLVIDGSTNGATFCGEGPYGIYYFDSSGTINHVAIRNQYPTGPGLECFDPSGVIVATNNITSSVVTVQNSTIHGFQGEGVWAFGQGSTATIKNNIIGGNATGNGSNGIAITGGANGSISSNTITNVIEPVSFPNIGGAGYGVLVQCSQGVVMSMNNVSNVQVGVYLSSGSFCTTGNADSSTITKNTFSQTHIFDGIYACGNYNLVQGNTFNSTSEAAVRIDSSCNPGFSGYFNTVSSNTIDEACTPSLVDPLVSGSNTVGSNTSYNVAYNQLLGTVLTSGFCSASGGPSSPTARGRVTTRPFLKPVFIERQ